MNMTTRVTNSPKKAIRLTQKAVSKVKGGNAHYVSVPGLEVIRVRSRDYFEKYPPQTVGV